MCGGGSRWREEQAEVLDFAEKLHYDHSPGGSLIPETDDKGAWIDWRDDFSAWKDKNVALEDSGQAWWQTYAAPSAGGSGGGGDSGGESGSGLLTNLGTGIGPYPLYNMYFPQLVPEYETPQAQDWSQYGLIDPAYQPWTVQGGQQYVPENIWNYAPPQINRQPVQYAGPPMGGLMEVIMPAEEGGNGDDDDYDWWNDPEGRKGLPDPRYDDDPNRPGYNFDGGKAALGKQVDRYGQLSSVGNVYGNNDVTGTAVAAAMAEAIANESDDDFPDND